MGNERIVIFPLQWGEEFGEAKTMRLGNLLASKRAKRRKELTKRMFPLLHQSDGKDLYSFLPFIYFFFVFIYRNVRTLTKERTHPFLYRPLSSSSSSSTYQTDRSESDDISKKERRTW